MIKLGGTTKDGRKFVLLGLSEMNIIKLREKKPIVVHGVEIGLPELETLIIHWGETEDALAKEFSEFIGPETNVRDHRREKKQ